MTILKDISILWSLFHTLILFLFLFESRYPKNKAMTLTLSTMIPLILANLALAIYLDSTTYSMLMLLTLSHYLCQALSFSGFCQNTETDVFSLHSVW